MKKIVIIGGTSSLARYLLPKLSNEYIVFTMGRQECDIYCDLANNLDSILLPENTDIVIHAAASFSGYSDEEIINTEKINSLGTLKICMASHKANVKHLIVISTVYSELNEDSQYYNIYSISKRHSEELATYYCKCNDLQLTILKPSQIYDEKGYFMKSQPLLYLMADNAESGNDINIYGTNDAKRNYIHIEDITEIIDRIIKIECTGVYSCTNPGDVKLTDIARGALTAFNNGGSIKFLEDKNDIPDNIFIKDTRLYEKINFYPKIDIAMGMKKIFEYRKRNTL